MRKFVWFPNRGQIGIEAIGMRPHLRRQSAIVPMSFVLVLVSGAISITLGCARPVENQDRVHRDEARIRFAADEMFLGEVFVNSETPFHAPITNLSDKSQEISHIHSSCNCTELNIATSLLEPGETSKLDGTFRAGGRAGVQTSTVLVTTADGAHAPLAVKANVRAYLRCVPEMIVLRPNSATTEDAKAVIDVVNEDKDKDVTITVSQAELPPTLRITPQSAHLAPGERACLGVQCLSTCVFEQQTTLVVRTDHPVQHAINIDLDLQPVLSLRIVPSTLAYGVIRKIDLVRKDRCLLHVQGTLADQVKLADVVTPTFLNWQRDSDLWKKDRTIRLLIEDAFEGADLSSVVNVVIAYGDRTIAVPVPVSGFLFDGP